MGIRPPKLTNFRNQQEIDQWARSTPVVPDPGSVTEDQIRDGGITEPKLATGSISTRALANGAVTNAKLRDSNALSVMGRPQDTDGPPTDIAFATSGQFLVRRGDQLVADTLTNADTGLSTALAAYYTKIESDTRYVALSNVLDGAKTYDPPSIADDAEASTTVTVTGAALGDFALASFSLSTQGIKLAAQVTAANTVTVNLHNRTGGVLDLASGTLRARVWKQ